MISQNPVLSFNMVWRFVNDLESICKLFEDHSSTGKFLNRTIHT